MSVLSIVVVPELPECSAFGNTEEEALNEIKTAIELWIETAKKEGYKIPEPAGKELLRTVVDFAAMPHYRGISA